MHFIIDRRVRVVAAGFALALLSACDGKSPSGPASKNQPPADANTGANAKPAYEGNFETASKQALVGWVWDPGRPDTPIHIEVFDGPTKVASVLADQVRADLRDAGKGNGRHGFLLPLPSQLQDGKEHSLSIRPSGSNVAIGPARTLKSPVSK